MSNINNTQITDSPIGAVLLIIGSAVAVAALICVIIQIYKNHISDRSMRREFACADNANQSSHNRVPKKLKALGERFRELDIPPVYSFTGDRYSEHFTVTAKRVYPVYVCCHTLNSETLDKKLFVSFDKARQYIFREVMDIVLNSYGEEGYKVYTSKLNAEEKAMLGI